MTSTPSTPFWQSQVNGLVDDIDQLSPRLAELYQVLADNKIFPINQAVAAMRDSAWRFTILPAVVPGFTRPFTIWARDRKVAARADLIYHPPGIIGVIEATVREIAQEESRDVVSNSGRAVSDTRRACRVPAGPRRSLGHQVVYAVK
jgi:hypothetical protein